LLSLADGRMMDDMRFLVVLLLTSCGTDNQPTPDAGPIASCSDLGCVALACEATLCTCQLPDGAYAGCQSP